MNINRDTLYDVLKVARGLTKGKIVSILEYVLLAPASDNMLLVAATNLMTTLIARLPVHGDEIRAVAVPCHTLAELIEAVTDREVVLQTAGNQTLVVECGNMTAKLRTRDVEDFPALPQREDTPLFTVDGSVYRTAIRRVMHAAGTEQGRPVLTAIAHDVSEDDTASLVAADGYRLAVNNLALGIQPANKGNQLLLPATGLRALVSLLTDGESVSLYQQADGSMLVFSAGNYEVAIQPVQGTYPNYRAIIPGNFATSIAASTSALLRSVRLASLMTDALGNQQVTLKTGINSLTLSAIDQQRGDVTDVVETEVSGPEVSVTLNARYLLDALQAVGEETVYIGLNAPLAPIMLYSADRAWLEVIMPLEAR